MVQFKYVKIQIHDQYKHNAAVRIKYITNKNWRSGKKTSGKLCVQYLAVLFIKCYNNSCLSSSKENDCSNRLSNQKRDKVHWTNWLSDWLLNLCNSIKSNSCVHMTCRVFRVYTWHSHWYMCTYDIHSCTRVHMPVTLVHVYMLFNAGTCVHMVFNAGTCVHMIFIVLRMYKWYLHCYMRTYCICRVCWLLKYSGKMKIRIMHIKIKKRHKV